MPKSFSATEKGKQKNHADGKELMQKSCAPEKGKQKIMQVLKN